MGAQPHPDAGVLVVVDAEVDTARTEPATDRSQRSMRESSAEVMLDLMIEATDQPPEGMPDRRERRHHVGSGGELMGDEIPAAVW